MDTDVRGRRGALVARALRGAWRDTPPVLTIAEAELISLAPTLLASGAGPLTWWRIRDSPLAHLPAMRELHEAYRVQVLRYAVREREIEQVVGLLQGVDAEPALCKGWAAARLYPDMAVRPLGDIDIFVKPEQVSRARAALDGLRLSRGGAIDFQESETLALYRADVRAMYDRACTVPMGDSHVKVLSPEDHLSMLCVHFLGHGAWRPIWLCDIAAAMERITESFNWETCLGQDQRRAGWILCALALAHETLGAHLAVPPSDLLHRQAAPRWLSPMVLKQWDVPYQPMSYGAGGFSAPMASYWHRPRGIWSALRERWPNPITATIRLAGPFNNLPRLPFQLAYAALRCKQFLAATRNPLRKLR